MVLCVISCGEKKQGKLEITEKKYHLSQFSDNGWSLDASGKIKNVGEVDVKKVVVTGVCKSCVEIWIPEKWFTYSQDDDIVHAEQKEVEQAIGNAEIEASRFDQKAVIGYLAVGDEESFSFKEFAYFYTQSKEKIPEMPPEADLDVIIESFESVQK
jgi:hypothetical protein